MSDAVVEDVGLPSGTQDKAHTRRQPFWLLYRGGVAPAFLVAILFGVVFGGNSYWIYVGAEVALYVLISIGVNLLVGFAGEAFIGQGALVAIGAYTTALLMTERHWSFWAATIPAVLITVAAGLLVALPSLRLSAWYFGLITLGFDGLVHDLLVQYNFTGGASGVLGIPMPRIAGHVLNGRELYWLIAVVDLLAAVVVFNLVRSRFGRGWIGLRDAKAAVPASGAGPLALKACAFAVTATLCGLAGAFFAVLHSVISPDNFDLNFAIFFVVAVVVGGSGRLWGPVVGCLVFFAVPDVLEFLSGYRLLVYGAALLVLMRFAPDGIIGITSRVGRFAVRRFRPLVADSAERPAGVTIPAHDDHPPSGGSEPSTARKPGDVGVPVVLDSVSLSFGGVRALAGLTLSVPAGHLYAIVGPNGSGKTSALNAISGFYRPQAGTIHVGGKNVVGMAPHRIARLGLARTFQTPRILGSLGVIDNMLLGAYTTEQSSFVVVALHCGRAAGEARVALGRARDLAVRLGLGACMDARGDEISHGQQRLVEIARALMAEPRVLLLDEPAGGLSDDDMEHLSTVITDAVASGITVILIEHHIDLVAQLAAEVMVMDAGAAIASGRPTDVFALPEVVAAYMGTPVVAGTE